jgi:hypothetical protein
MHHSRGSPPTPTPSHTANKAAPERKRARAEYAVSVEHHSDETKRRLAEAHRGKPKSAEHKRAITEGLLRRSRNGGETPHGTPAKYKTRTAAATSAERRGRRTTASVAPRERPDEDEPLAAPRRSRREASLYLGTTWRVPARSFGGLVAPLLCHGCPSPRSHTAHRVRVRLRSCSSGVHR